MTHRGGPTTAMVLAAGLGTRLRPLTLDRPKALVEVGGKALIDHVLDRLAAVGVRRAVVNVHAFADALEAHLAGRKDMEIIISDERDGLLDTGGGLRRARPWLGDAPVLAANIDTVWEESAEPLLSGLIAAWDGAAMDDLLLLIDKGAALGFDGPGDFFRDEAGRLRHRGPADDAPLAYMGAHLINPRIIDAWPEGPHGIFDHWMRLADAGRLHGVVADGFWMHVGDPAARDAAHARLTAGRR